MKAVIIISNNTLHIIYVESFDALSKIGIRQWCMDHDIPYDSSVRSLCIERLDDINITHFVV